MTDLRFEYKNLYDGDVNTGFSIVTPSEIEIFDYKDRKWKVRYPDGSYSDEFTGSNAAREYAVSVYSTIALGSPRKATGAFSAPESYPGSLKE